MNAEIHISIYDSCTLVGVVSDSPRKAWRTARACVNGLANDAGPARVAASHREWYRTPGRFSYERGGFRAVSTFRSDRRAK